MFSTNVTMKSMREINVETYSLSLLTAKEDILNPRTSTNWALFAYDGIMNRLKLADSGAGGLQELMTKLHPRRPLYGMCRISTKQPCIVMIIWVGSEVDEYRRAECASHLPAIRTFFKEVNIFLPARSLDEISEERICTMACKAAMVMPGHRGRQTFWKENREEVVGTNYKRTIPAAEIQRIQRDSFWAQAEREEEERKKEERRRAAEDRRQREIERIHQERREALERERKLNEKEEKIKEQRRIQAQMEAEAHRQERIKWEQQDQQHEEEEVRAQYLCSESKEKAAEAAALVSQRVVNPREFFRQLSTSSVPSVHESPHPGSPYSGVRSPYRKLRRSQTDDVFIYNESYTSTPASPYRPAVESNFFPSTPTTQSPTFAYSDNVSPLLHNPVLVSPSNSGGNFTSDHVVVSPKTQIPPSLPEPPISSYVSKADSVPPSTPQLQKPPSPPPNTTPITAIIESLVFYPPPPTIEQLKPDNLGTDEQETTLDFPPPPPAFEDLPEPSIDVPETQITKLDMGLSTQSTSDPSVFPSAPPTSPLPQSCPTPLDLSCLSPPQPPSRPLPALPVAPRLLRDLELEREFTARASVISTVEEEEDLEEEEEEEKDEKRYEEECINEESASEIRDQGQDEDKDKVTFEESESRAKKRGGWCEQDMKIMKEQQSKNDQEVNAVDDCEIEKDQDEEIMEKHESEKEQDGKTIEEHKSERGQDGKVVEEHKNEKEQDEKNIEEHGSESTQDGKIIEEHESEKEEDGKIIEERESEKEEDGKIIEECESEKEEDGKIIEECESEKEEDGKIIKECESEKEEDGKIIKECESEKEEDGKIIKEHESEKEEDEKIIEECESEKEEDGKIIEECESEKEEDGKIIEECESEKEQDVKFVEELKNKKIQDEKFIQQCESKKEQQQNLLEEQESENEQDSTIIEECWNEKEQDGNIMEEHENKYVRDGKIIEECESEKEQQQNILEKRESEKEQDSKIIEECGKEKEEDGNIMEEHESKYVHDGNIIEDCESEKNQDGGVMEDCESEQGKDWKIMQEHENEKEQDEKIIKEHSSEIIQDGNIIEECESEKKQDGGVMENSESEQEKDLQEHENEKKQDEKIMEEQCKEKQDGKAIEKQDRVKIKDAKIKEQQESGDIQERKSLKECVSEKEDGKITEERDGEVTDKHESEEMQDLESNKEHDGINQGIEGQTLNLEGQEHSSMDIDRTPHLTVLKEESYTEIIRNNEATNEEVAEEMKNDNGNEMEEVMKPLCLEVNQYPPSAEILCSHNAPQIPESHATKLSQYSDTSLPEIVSTNQDKNEPQISSIDTSQQSTDLPLSFPATEDKSDQTSLSHQTDSQPDDTIQEKTEYVLDPQTFTIDPLTVISSNQECLCPLSKTLKSSHDYDENSTTPEQTEPHTDISVRAEEIKEDEKMCRNEGKIKEVGNDLAESGGATHETSPNNQASIDQSDEEEGLATVSHCHDNSDIAVGLDLKECVIHQSEMDPTNEISDFEEGEEAISLIAIDNKSLEAGPNSKCDHAPELDQMNKAIKHEFLQIAKTTMKPPNDIRNDKEADEEHLEIIGNVSTSPSTPQELCTSHSGACLKEDDH